MNDFEICMSTNCIECNKRLDAFCTQLNCDISFIIDDMIDSNDIDYWVTDKYIVDSMNKKQGLFE